LPCGSISAGIVISGYVMIAMTTQTLSELAGIVSKKMKDNAPPQTMKNLSIEKEDTLWAF